MRPAAATRTGTARAWARAALRLELAQYAALARWVLRRPHVPPGATPVGYARLVTPVLWLWIGASAAEVLVVDLVLPWEAARLPVLVLGLWGLLWMLGMLAAYRTRPHLVTDTDVQVRGGALAAVTVPLRAVTDGRVAEQDLPSSIRTVHHDHRHLLVGVSGRTNLQLRLAEPLELEVRGALPRTVVADRVGLWVDDPRAALRVLREAGART